MKQLVLATAAVLALAAGSVSAHPIASVKGQASSGKAAPAGAVCTTGTSDTGIGIASETFTDFSGYDSSGASDCTVKGKASTSSIQTAGTYYNGSGPANSVTVTFYKSKKGKPGKVAKSYSGLSFTDSTGIGSLGFKFPATKLKKTEWIGVQPSMTFGVGGQWGWDLSTGVTGAVDQWEEQGGLGTGCTTWEDTASCVGYGGDFLFTAS